MENLDLDQSTPHQQQIKQLLPLKTKQPHPEIEQHLETERYLEIKQIRQENQHKD